MLTKDEKKSEVMNLIGYGMAKFNNSFVQEFGFNNNSVFARYIVSLGLADTERAVTNRRDSFDPYFDNGRRGWSQRNQREHIKLFIDSLFGNENVHSFANIVKLYIKEINSDIVLQTEQISPTQKSRFKQLQETGKEAEFYFINNFATIPIFENGALEDARLWGDGYDFQVQCEESYYLAEVKGIQTNKGTIRMTQNEYNKALEYKESYVLVVISNLINTPRISYIENPISQISFTPREQTSVQTNYYSEMMAW